MSNTLSTTWVKNVYSLRTDLGKARVQSYTGLYPTLLSNQLHGDNTQVIPSFLNTVLTPFSTIIFAVSYLLRNQLYLFSTPPIITKTKEK